MKEYLLYYSPILYLTQSLWRDEAFSVLVAQHSIPDIIKISAGDFATPLYYILLHIWMKLFGSSEIAIRLLSFVFHILGAFVGYFISYKYLFKNVKKSFLLVLFLVINPMLLYYAFEARMYSMLYFFSLFLTYLLLEKKWRWYSFFFVISFYTHEYIIFLFLAHAVWVLSTKKRKEIILFLLYTGVGFIFILPWAVLVLLRTLHTGGMWYYPVDSNLIKSIVGNLYTGFEGTPPLFWKYSKYISFFLFLISFMPLWHLRKKPYLLLILSCYIPIIVVLGISVVVPIYTTRYLIFSTAHLVMASSYILINIRHRVIRSVVLISAYTGIVLFSFWFPHQIRKVPLRDTISEIYTYYEKGDLLVSATPLTFFETLYYAKDKDNVYVYAKKGEHFPSYVGNVLIAKDRIISSFPKGKKVFLIQNDGKYSTIQ